MNNYTPETINYAPNGNITQKSDVGAYMYDATKINAVKEVNSNNLEYPPDELHVVVFRDIVYHLGIDVVG